MGKIGAAFGGKKKPSTTEIFLSLARQDREKKEAQNKLSKEREKLRKLGAGRAGRLGTGGKPGEDEEASIRRPGARTAKLLGS